MSFPNYPLAITAAVDGTSIDESLPKVLSLLKSHKIEVAGSAFVSVQDQRMATILVGSTQDRATALDVLAKAGLQVREGAAGI